MIKLTKRDLTHAGRPISISDTWISNGHWAIKKSLVKDPHRWTTLEGLKVEGVETNELAEQSVERLVPGAKADKWILTGVIVNAHPYTRNARPSDLVQYALEGKPHITTHFKRPYLSMLYANGKGVESIARELYGVSSDRPFRDLDSQMIVMPHLTEIDARIFVGDTEGGEGDSGGGDESSEIKTRAKPRSPRARARKEGSG